MTTKQVLQKTKKLIEKGWCKGSFIKKINGKYHYCLSGALGKVDPNDNSQAYSMISEAIPHYSIATWNDVQKDKSSVLSLLDEVISKCK